MIDRPGSIVGVYDLELVIAQVLNYSNLTTAKHRISRDVGFIDHWHKAIISNPSYRVNSHRLQW